MRKLIIFIVCVVGLAAIIYFLFFHSTDSLPHSNATFVAIFTEYLKQI